MVINNLLTLYGHVSNVVLPEFQMPENQMEEDPAAEFQLEAGPEGKIQLEEDPIAALQMVEDPVEVKPKDRGLRSISSLERPVHEQFRKDPRCCGLFNKCSDQAQMETWSIQKLACQNGQMGKCFCYGLLYRIQLSAQLACILPCDLIGTGLTLSGAVISGACTALPLLTSLGIAPFAYCSDACCGTNCKSFLKDQVDLTCVCWKTTQLFMCCCCLHTSSSVKNIVRFPQNIVFEEIVNIYGQPEILLSFQKMQDREIITPIYGSSYLEKCGQN